METKPEGKVGKEKRFPGLATGFLEEKRSKPQKDLLPDPISGPEPPQALKANHAQSNRLITPASLAGVFCKGIQYYDLKNIYFINNAGMANLIDLLRSLLKKGVEVRFVNVNDQIQKKIKGMGLDHILICG